MSSPTGIIPENLLKPEMVQELVEWLVKQPYPGALKAALLRGSAMNLGIQIPAKFFRRVERSGVDHGG